jgi:YesN/AraC family two-component response regulator
MKRLRRYLFHNPASFANTARTTLPHVRYVSYGNAREVLCQRVIEYIEIHLRDSITCKKLADEMKVSPFYLSDAFRKSTGITLMRYIQKKRIEAAKLMLTDNKERISDIAALAGYANIASFSGSFKKHAGCSPNEFRRRFARK